MVERKLLMLVLDNRKCPLWEWLSAIRDKPTRARIERQIDKLCRDLGSQKGLQGIGELKIDFGPGFRVYYGFLDEKTIVVLIGGASESALRAWKEEQVEGEEAGEGNEDESEKL